MDRCDDGLGAVSAADGFRPGGYRSRNAIFLPRHQQHGGRDAASGEHQDGVGRCRGSDAARLDPQCKAGPLVRHPRHQPRETPGKTPNVTFSTIWIGLPWS